MSNNMRRKENVADMKERCSSSGSGLRCLSKMRSLLVT